MTLTLECPAVIHLPCPCILPLSWKIASYLLLSSQLLLPYDPIAYFTEKIGTVRRERLVF